MILRLEYTPYPKAAREPKIVAGSGTAAIVPGTTLPAPTIVLLKVPASKLSKPVVTRK